jgi:DNA-binding LytR/AlgR family response regulator
MRIVIIEDELPAYKRLSKLVKEKKPAADIVAHLESVEQAGEWFRDNQPPDLLFLDIHLADGSGFDLLQRVKPDCPVVFVTAYDQYAVDAFKANSIDYLLKPVKKEDIDAAFDKLDRFGSFFSGKTPVTVTGAGLKEYKKRFVIRFGDHIKTLLTEEIAYCFSENKATFARTHDGRTYPMDHNLDALDLMLDPQEFFRANRQYIISLKAITEMKTYTKARVIIWLQPAAKEEVIVSSERAAEFKRWLGGE